MTLVPNDKQKKYNLQLEQNRLTVKELYAKIDELEKKNEELQFYATQYDNIVRREIATAAMQGLLSHNGYSIEYISLSIKIADALIKQLNEK